MVVSDVTREAVKERRCASWGIVFAGVVCPFTGAVVEMNP